MDELKTDVARIWKGEDGIVRVIHSDNAHVTAEAVTESLELGARLTGGCRAPALVDIRGVKSVTREARKIIAGEPAKALMLRQAYLVGSPLSRMLGNFMIGLNRTPFPTRIFTNEAAAITWLLSSEN